ncbi:unnamed protein product [Sphenostylis stenocarpa]|uniref:Uncharacterized protein n=1 Tax=Sphenostylis stenocarpa TaxID=92480 RepID=A0AA86VD04_9FABA|nr:unnamed protein product [Sphenostylis stenocarpa]
MDFHQVEKEEVRHYEGQEEEGKEFEGIEVVVEEESRHPQLYRHGIYCDFGLAILFHAEKINPHKE